MVVMLEATLTVTLHFSDDMVSLWHDSLAKGTCLLKEHRAKGKASTTLKGGLVIVMLCRIN
jgi:hypothetical protein